MLEYTRLHFHGYKTADALLCVYPDELTYFGSGGKYESTAVTLDIIYAHLYLEVICGGEGVLWVEYEPELANIVLPYYITLTQEDVCIGIHGYRWRHN